MKLKKQIIPAIGCASILLTGIALSHEIILTEIQPSISNVPTDTKVVEDPAITKITAEILTPIRQQEQRRHRFSRSMPTRSNVYELVEVSSDPSEGARYFDVLVTNRDYLSSIKILESANGQAKNAEAKVEPKTFLKLKYLTESNKVLIQQDKEWVEKSKHKFLMFLPLTVINK